MRPTDDVLGAYVDGELDPEVRAAVAAAIAGNPELAERVNAMQVLNRQLRTAHARALDEPVPARLVEAVQGPAPSVVVSLDTARLRTPAARPRRLRAFEWGAIAASVAVGVLVGHYGFQGSSTGLVAINERGINPGPELESALSTRLAGDPRSAGGVAIGLTFKDKTGTYCRTFSVADRAGLSGVACRDRDQWRIDALSASLPGAESSGPYRQAASALSPAIAEVVAAHIEGDPLDRAAEDAARRRGWR